MAEGYVERIRKKVGHDPIFLPCAGLILMKDKSEILMQKRADNHKWGLIGGACELGEKVIESVKRECLEEMGIIPIEPKLFNVFTGEEFKYRYSNGDNVYFHITVYIAQKYSGKIQIDNDEVIDYNFFDIKNLPRNINGPDIYILKDFKSTFFK